MSLFVLRSEAPLVRALPKTIFRDCVLCRNLSCVLFQLHPAAARGSRVIELYSILIALGKFLVSSVLALHFPGNLTYVLDVRAQIHIVVNLSRLKRSAAGLLEEPTGPR